MVRIIISLIKIYQKTLSPDHGVLKYKYPYGFCRFYPSCSEYSIKAFSKHGLVLGFSMSILRIIKCNPFTKPQINNIS